MNLLAAVALVYLIWDPSELFDASFQLSFLCVAAIGALACAAAGTANRAAGAGAADLGDVGGDLHLEPGACAIRVELRLAAETWQLWISCRSAGSEPPCAGSRGWLFFALEMAVISTVIQIGLALPMAEYFHRVSFTGFTANL